MAFAVPPSEPRSFRRDASPASKDRRRTAFRAAFLGELHELETQLGRFSDIEAAIRLRALSELEAGLTTDALCGLAARAF